MTLTAQQLTRRLEGIGGSEAAIAVNRSRFKSPVRLWQEKLGLVDPEDLSDNESVYLGVRLEDWIAREFARRRNVRVQRDNRTLVHPDHSFMLGHIDRRIVGVREGLECKYANSYQIAREFSEEEDTDQVPTEHLIQAHHYMAITGFEVWHIAALLPGKFRMYRVERDEDLIRSLTEAELRFWECVTSGIAPEPRDLDDCMALWPQDSGRTVHATAEVVQDAEQYRALKAQEKQTETDLQAVRLRLETFMQDASALMGPDGWPLLTWTSQSADRVDVKRLRAERPDIAAEFETESPSRVLRICKRRRSWLPPKTM